MFSNMVSFAFIVGKCFNVSMLSLQTYSANDDFLLHLENQEFLWFSQLEYALIIQDFNNNYI